MTEREIFAQAIQFEQAAERAAFLDRACQGNTALRERILRLLAERENLGDYLERPAVPLLPTPIWEKAGGDGSAYPTTDTLPHQRPGLRIGRYRLMEQIGEGGMGTVWVAEQTEPVKRRVALKLIKPGMDTRQVLSRFEAERQALALMDHPNIAKVFDGGMTDEGRPYFVMEYVKGVPITEYCDNARLSIQDRLKLFVPVCQAVQHAHQKGVIHRDIKPSNILVCLYDGQPVPKVIDFGLAKAISQPLTDHTLYTAHGMMVGTPLYMSPEQAEFNNLDVDTRTDIYSLGVILYELLTGSTPLEKQLFKDAAFAEILRLIKEVEPPKPSTRIAQLRSAQRKSGGAKRTPRSEIRIRQFADLDWIVMKALEKDRSRRYETANSLARDIERYFQDEPVEAGPPSVGYRFHKFVRRNKGALVTTALVLLAAMIGGGFSLAKSIEAKGARKFAEEKERMERMFQMQNLQNVAYLTLSRNQRLKLDEMASVALNRISAQLAQGPHPADPPLEPLRKELLKSVIEYWDEAIGMETSPEGKPQGRAGLYYLQRMLCLARAGLHEQASQEAAELWRVASVSANDSASRSTRLYAPLERTEALVYNLARVYALCAAAAQNDEELAKKYADRAMYFLNLANEDFFFTDPVKKDRLKSNPDLAALEKHEAFREFRKGILDKRHGTPSH